MAVLAELQCTVCKSGENPMIRQEIDQYLEDLPGWELIKEEGIDKLRRSFNFPDFSSAADFTVQVAKLAEQSGHHPVILLEWGKVTVYWWTHKVNGLHVNDFIMAAKTTRVYEKK